MRNSTSRIGGRLTLGKMGITEEEVARRKTFLQFEDKDAMLLGALNDIARRYADGVIDQFYVHLLSFPEGREWFRDPTTLSRVRAAQKEYFLNLTRGVYDMNYVENRLRTGAMHERISLPMKTYLGMYNFYLRAVLNQLAEAFPGDPDKIVQSSLSLMKLTFMDISLAIDTYIYQRERTIRQQQEVIQELSTPVLQIRERLLLLPIIGVIDTGRARQLTEQVLHAIRANRAKVVVIDITGVPSVDSKVANHLLRTVDACRLMGASVIVTGLLDNLAQTLVTIGVDMTKINAVGDLKSGIEQAERLLGYRVVRETEEASV